MDLIFFFVQGVIWANRSNISNEGENRRDRKEQPPGEILQMETPNLFEPIEHLDTPNTPNLFPDSYQFGLDRTTRANSFGIVWEQLEQLEPLERLECLE